MDEYNLQRVVIVTGNEAGRGQAQLCLPSRTPSNQSPSASSSSSTLLDNILIAWTPWSGRKISSSSPPQRSSGIVSMPLGVLSLKMCGSSSSNAALAMKFTPFHQLEWWDQDGEHNSYSRQEEARDDQTRGHNPARMMIYIRHERAITDGKKMNGRRTCPVTTDKSGTTVVTYAWPLDPFQPALTLHRSQPVTLFIPGIGPQDRLSISVVVREETPSSATH